MTWNFENQLQTDFSLLFWSLHDSFLTGGCAYFLGREADTHLTHKKLKKKKVTVHRKIMFMSEWLVGKADFYAKESVTCLTWS